MNDKSYTYYSPSTKSFTSVAGGVFNLARLVVVSGLDHSIVRTDKLTDNDRSHGRTSPNNVPPRMSLNYKGIPVDRIDGLYAIL